MSQLGYTRAGSGETVVLLHGIGLSRAAWEPVRALLEPDFDVIAVDLPGFGASPPLSPDVEPTPAALATRVASLLAELDVHRPHVVGNSLGGWVALEFAQSQDIATLTLLSPAGLWRKRTPRYCRASLWTTRAFARRLRPVLEFAARFRCGRYLIFRQTHGKPGRLTPDQARTAIRSMGGAVGFDATFRATLDRRFTTTGPIDAPVTLAFGAKDMLLLPWQSRHMDELPEHTTVRALPGCGHVPMNDDPAAVAELIATSVRRLHRLPRSGDRLRHPR
jgi:pimeloyl-ACP methyl ester carboxylesterase